ncbi:stage V sporulation protein D [Clostridium oceanicum]|uniref:Stage V sporulation protein D n=1 Tax=Clostridium oceanicum TaxID=1543 RepID=A0ABN1JNZ6_9CLOT
MSKKEYRDKVIIRKRMVVVFCFLFICFIGLIVRMSNVMIVQSPKLKEKAVDQWTSEVEIDAKRGRILDRNEHELAISANVYRIDLDMNALKDTLKNKKMTKDELASKLSTILEMKKEEVLKVLNKKLANGLPLQSATLKRRIEKDKADKVRDLKLRGLLVSADTKRYYPNNNFLSHVMGHTNSDGKGLTGVELYYNSILAGKPGVRVAETDRKSEDLPYAISRYTKPEDGKDLILTIDEMIQHFAEQTAEKALKDNQAKAVTVAVMDPKTGEVLGLANKPDYNPNDPWEKGKTYNELQKKWRNRAINDTFEPGSIFKPITATAALEENVVNSDTKFTCNGSMKIANKTIHCWKPEGHGTQNFEEILKNSCNMGLAQLGKMIGKEKLNEYIKKFGLGQKTGIDLPGEARGIIKSTKNITDIDLATISFGQTDTVSPIQYLTAFNAIANGGKLIKPHVMKEIGHYDEENNKEIVDEKNKLEYKQILHPDKMSTLRGILEKVVSEGGGKNAFIEGYHIGGKTGTAQKAGKGGYEAGKYVASFAGMAPVNDPRVTLLVSIDEPNPAKHFAAQTAAPAAKDLFKNIFNYLATINGDEGEDLAKSLLEDVNVPELRGMKTEDAKKKIKDLKLDAEIQSKGEYIVDMNPKPGYTVKEGSKIILYTGSTPNYNKVVAVPNVKGDTTKEAMAILKSIGLKGKIKGDGIISKQSIPPKKSVKKGTVINLNAEPIGD